jgi:prephenate dehydrogenase
MERETDPETLVVGAGEMGRWFGGLYGAPAFADRDPEAARAAAEATGGRAVGLDGSESFEVVCVAVPIPAAAETVREQAPRAERAVVDVTGVMEVPLAAMTETAPERERASLHPLFAASHAPGKVALAVPEGVPDGPVVPDLRERLEAAGNAVVRVTPAEHNDAMCTVQGRTHAAVLAFALAAGDDDPVPEGLTTPVYEGLRDLADQVTGNTPRVYADIQDAFDGAADVAEAARLLAEADHDAFEDLYEDAGR